MNYVVPVTIAIIALLFVFPEGNEAVKTIVGVIFLGSLVFIVNYLPNKLRESIDVLERIQTEIFFAQQKLDSMKEEEMRQLIGVLHKVEVLHDRGGMNLKDLERRALESINS